MENKIECFGLINRYILFGGGKLLVLTAKRLKKLGFQVLVVTSERHSKEIISIDNKEGTFLDWLKRKKLSCKISKNIEKDSNVLNFISDGTIGLSFGAAWIFKADVIKRFNGKLLNLHDAQLPRDRGGGEFSWRIMRRDKIGVSLIHKIDLGVDTGDIVFQKKYTFPENCRISIDYQEYSIDKYREVLEVFFDRVKNTESFCLQSQQEKFSSYWPRLSTNDHGFIDWNWKSSDIESFICAFDSPYPGASTFINGNRVRIKGCYLSIENGDFHPFQRGLIYRKDGGRIFIAAVDGTIIINQVIDESGLNVEGRLQVGDRFYTPQQYIEKSLQFRAIYTPTGLKYP